MKILLLGGNGQLGWELRRSLAVLGELSAPTRRPASEAASTDASMQDGLCGDLEDLAGLAAAVRRLRPDAIVNAAAYTAVDRAESERSKAHHINALAVGVLAEEAERCGAWLIHYSTDYVFNGAGNKPWTEQDQCAPLNVYGASKLEGETLAQRHCKRHLILRTSWVYAARGGNFAKTMLKLAQDRERLTVIDDQVGAPTGADLLADLTAHLVRASAIGGARSGTYHAVAAGATTWHGYAKHVIEFGRAAGLNIKVPASNVEPVATTAYPTPARRPANSRLDTQRLRESFNFNLPDWRVGVDRMLTEVLGR